MASYQHDELMRMVIVNREDGTIVRQVFAEYLPTLVLSFDKLTPSKEGVGIVILAGAYDQKAKNLLTSSAIMYQTLCMIAQECDAITGAIENVPDKEVGIRADFVCDLIKSLETAALNAMQAAVLGVREASKGFK